MINSDLEDDRAQLCHDYFTLEIEKHPGIHSSEFLGQRKDSAGRACKCYNLPEREVKLMVMSESLARIFGELLVISRHIHLGYRLPISPRLHYDPALLCVM